MFVADTCSASVPAVGDHSSEVRRGSGVSVHNDVWDSWCYIYECMSGVTLVVLLALYKIIYIHAFCPRQCLYINSSSVVRVVLEHTHTHTRDCITGECVIKTGSDLNYRENTTNRNHST